MMMPVLVTWQEQRCVSRDLHARSSYSRRRLHGYERAHRDFKAPVQRFKQTRQPSKEKRFNSTGPLEFGLTMAHPIGKRARSSAPDASAEAGIRPEIKCKNAHAWYKRYRDCLSCL